MFDSSSGRLAHIDGADVFTLRSTVTRSETSMISLSLWEMKRMLLFLRGKLAHGSHKLVDLLRSEDGGRLVKDQYLIIAVEHFEDLNTLLHTDGDVLDLCVEVDVRPYFSLSA